MSIKLLPDKLVINDVDLAYSSAKARYKESHHANGLTYEAFVHALLLLSQTLHEHEKKAST